MAGMVLFNIGWMTHYCGDQPSDRIVNGGGYVAKNETGGEVENFLPRSGRYRGYVWPPGSTLNLERLGASPGADHVDGATVVFSATRPGGGGYVVGWYTNARVWRKHRPQHPHGYIAEAKVDDCQLLEVDDRVFCVPRARTGVFGLGQSNVRYLDGTDAERFVSRLRAYIQRRGLPRRPPSPHQVDPAIRKQVETAAIECVVQYYKSRGFDWSSVERDNVGWDLECVQGKLKLLVEVKGCSGAAQVELTPNEYDAMKRFKHRYRLAIVSTALEDPQLSIVRYNPSDETWRDQDGRVAYLEDRVGVRIRL